MIRSRVDLPEPFRPSTPILAPGKKLREMSFRISRLGGTTLPTRFMVYTYWAILAESLSEIRVDNRKHDRCLAKAFGVGDSGSSKTGMFLRSVQGRIHSVSRIAHPEGRHCLKSTPLNVDRLRYLNLSGIAIERKPGSSVCRYLRTA